LDLERKFLQKVDSLSTELVDLTREMIRVPSENPPGDEHGISELVAQKMKAIGFEVELVEPKPRRVNTLGTLRSSGKGRSFLFNGHYDTVPVGNREFWSVDPFEGLVRNGRIYGRGSGDEKGAIAAMIVAAKALDQAGVQLKGNLLLHAVADEETGSTFGTRYLVENGYETRGKVDMAVVGEASVYDNRIYARTAVRGLQWLKIIVRGRAAHSSRPKDGVNAVLNMCKILLALNEHKFTFRPHDLLPDPTIAPGTIIRGGTKENIVPELCEATCDIRIIPGMTGEGVIREVRAVIDSLKRQDQTIDAEVIPISSWPPSEISTDEELFQIAKRAVATVSGYDLTPRGFTGSNDTSWLTNVAHIPAMAFGPGDNYKSGAHGPDEWVSIDRLLDFAKIYGLMAMEACGT
jgi:acetylornithine deacetylase/succinyl-diaminopimelate desuccinylase family protein